LIGHARGPGRTEVLTPQRGVGGKITGRSKYVAKAAAKCETKAAQRNSRPVNNSLPKKSGIQGSRGARSLEPGNSGGGLQPRAGGGNGRVASDRRRWTFTQSVKKSSARYGGALQC